MLIKLKWIFTNLSVFQILIINFLRYYVRRFYSVCSIVPRPFPDRTSVTIGIIILNEISAHKLGLEVRSVYKKRIIGSYIFDYDLFGCFSEFFELVTNLSGVKCDVIVITSSLL